MTDTPSEFGPNVWLVDQMYRHYQEDPDSVSASWQEFFEDYRPGDAGYEPAPTRDEPAEVTPVAAPATAPAAAPQADAAPVGEGEPSRLRARDEHHSFFSGFSALGISGCRLPHSSCRAP